MPKTCLQATGEAMPADKVVTKYKGESSGISNGGGIGNQEGHKMNMVNHQVNFGLDYDTTATPITLSQLIEAHRAAEQALDAAIGHEWEAEKRYKEKRQERRLVQVRKGLWHEVDAGFPRHWSELRDNARDEIAREFDRLRAAFPGALSDGVRNAAIADLNREQCAAYRRLVSVINDIAAEQEDLGYSGAIEVRDELCERERAAALALLSYRCETIEECRLKGAYVAGCSVLTESIHGLAGSP